jgi:hypothetical protein
MFKLSWATIAKLKRKATPYWKITVCTMLRHKALQENHIDGNFMTTWIKGKVVPVL